jgi:DNA-binding NtrC family response regulator
LHYRLKVVELHVPPLRERRDDILPLARLLLADAAARMGRPISGLTPGAAVQMLKLDETEYILGVLELNGGNQTQTAKQLAIGSGTLYRKLKAYRNTPAPPDSPPSE